MRPSPGAKIAGEALADEPKLREALEAGKPYKAAMETKVKRRSLALSLVATRAAVDAETWVIIEISNDSKVRELESMITS